MLELTPKEILNLVKEHKKEVSKVKKYRDAIDNKYSIRFKKEEKNKASNKCPINFAKKIKNNVHGYMFGEQVKITHKDNDNLKQFFSEMFAYNYTKQLMSKTGEEMLDVGKSYWLFYIDDNAYLKILLVPLEEMIYIKNEKDEDITDLAIRYYYREGIDIDKQELVVEVYTDEAVHYYVENTKGGLVPDYTLDEPIKYHVFGHVPVIEFLNNDKQSEYKDVLDLIDLYNKIFNLGIDETEDIRNAYLAILGAFLDDEVINNALKSRVFMIDSEEGNNVDIKFLNKNIDTTSFESFLDRIRRLIFEISGVPDTLSLENKSQDLSGRAMKQLLREMENRCIIKENNIEYALVRFLRIVRRYVKIKTNLDYNLSDFEIVFKRNTQDNTQIDALTMDDFVKLKETGLLDKESLLNLLKFVTDSQNIIEKKQKEDEELYGIDYDFEGHNNE